MGPLLPPAKGFPRLGLQAPGKGKLGRAGGLDLLQDLSQREQGCGKVPTRTCWKGRCGNAGQPWGLEHSCQCVYLAFVHRRDVPRGPDRQAQGALQAAPAPR